ncbi:MAG: 4-(cytidine 5'-diphospho)-2-C-methyl-D-erythritol kinase [Cellvibrionaceae bacterium]|nr:4-(cytidine 5'-diphospho)-2-C-methyl-D-erythritol kinase [Cellvibrionaceae bacterium]
MTPQLSLPAPAKINLFLHITGCRADGYHSLQTLFQLLDYCDHLHFTLRRDNQCQLSASINGVADDDNLIIKAARALQAKSNSQRGITIGIEKNIPMGGGLGGGSSNAATTLLALNHLWELDLSLNELCAIGLNLGADVPVFIRGHSAWAEGVGEQLSPVTLPQRYYLIIKPRCHVATADIFSDEELTRDTAAITVAAFFEQGGRNDCETVVCKHYPEVSAALKWLRRHNAKAQMTGTGGCIFAAFSSVRETEHLAARMPNDWDYFIASGINQSPAHALLPK